MIERKWQRGVDQRERERVVVRKRMGDDTFRVKIAGRRGFLYPVATDPTFLIEELPIPVLVTA